MYNIYKSSSHVVTSHHSLVPYSIIFLSHLHHYHIAAASPPAPLANNWLSGPGSANWAQPFLGILLHSFISPQNVTAIKNTKKQNLTKL